MNKKRNKEPLPFVDIQLTAEEINTLDGEVSDVWKFYILLSRYRDFKTGIVGERTRVTTLSLKHGMQILKKQGRQPFNASGGSIERWIEKLVELNLVVRHGDNVFFLPKARRDDTIQKRCDRSATPSATDKKDVAPCVKLEENSKKQELENRGATGGATEVRTIPKISEETNIMLLGDTDFSKFNNLLNEYGFRPEQILHPKTSAMIKAWIGEGITIADAKEGIEATNAKRKPGHPSYYLHNVLSVPRAKLETEREVKDERLRDTTGSRVRKRSADDAASDYIDEVLNRNHKDHF